ncbi:AAA family ATPase [Pseudomonas segetis]|uniref:AAA domain-containing protein n=1 Tax=Pseudomonas segetis TaxID=298908 RepID=A0A239CB62_9PSED|nr:AAA family ATPase [Pseudomonas segetis]SNS16603.1 AAA domain-containing protein [Pseudomonas segetis]
MATVTLILGKSGSGKSTAIRNLDPGSTALIQIIKKPLPFKDAKAWKAFVTDDWSKIIGASRKTQRKVIVIDDFQYMLANEFMRRSEEKGFDKFSDIGRHTWDVFDALLKLPDDVRVYILSHTEETDAGQIKMKTIGKMLDDKITLEGMVTIVLRALVQDRQHLFSTRNNGSDTTKAPMGMFDDELIDNDLAAVDAAICEYYDLAQPVAA